MKFRDESGQINSGIVWTIVIMLIAVSFGGLIFGKIQTVAQAQASDDNAANDSIEENIVAQVSSTGATIFPLILLLVLIGVFVAIIGVLRVLG